MKNTSLKTIEEYEHYLNQTIGKRQREYLQNKINELKKC